MYSLKLIVILTVLVFIPTMLPAQENTTDKEKTFKFSFKNAEITTVLNYFKDISGFTVIVDPDLTGKRVSISADNEPHEKMYEILKVILEGWGFTFEKQGNILKVIKIKDAKIKSTDVFYGYEVSVDKEDKFITQIVPIKYLKAETVMGNIKNFLSKDGNVTANIEANKIIITDYSSAVKKIIQIILEIDKGEVLKDQIIEMIYLKYAVVGNVYKILTEELKLTQIDLRYPVNKIITPQQTDKDVLKIVKLEERNALMIMGIKEDVEKVKQVVEKLEQDARATDEIAVLNIRLKFMTPSKMIEILSQITTEEGKSSRPIVQDKQELSLTIKSSKQLKLKGEVKVLEYKQQSALLLTGLEEDIKKVAVLIGQFEKPLESDEKGKQTVIGETETKIITIQNSKAQDVADIFFKIIDGQKKSKTEQQIPSAQQDIYEGLQIIVDVKNNAVVVIAKPQNMAQIEKVITDLDKLPLQVFIEVIIIELNFEKGQRVGVNINDLITLEGSPFKNKIQFPFSLVTDGSKSIGSGTGFVFASPNMKYFMQALQTMGDVNVLSTPRILTLNNHEAIINVVESTPVKTDTTVVIPTTGPPIQKDVFTYKDIGIKLVVTPHINDKGILILDIFQEISDIIGTSVPDRPNFSKREIKSKIIVKNGETAVLGGLIRNKKTTSETKIPLLGDIPVLGYLFGYTENREQKSELMLFLTPHVIQTIDDLKKVTDKYGKDYNEILKK